MSKASVNYLAPSQLCLLELKLRIKEKKKLSRFITVRCPVMAGKF